MANAYEFENLPNFRQAGGTSLSTTDGKVVKDGMVFRCSRTDFVTQKDKSLFQQLGIKSIIDLREKSEYERADGEKRLDNLYIPFVVKNGSKQKMRRRRVGDSNSVDESSALGYRYLISLTSMEMIWYLFGKLNFFIRWSSLLLALFDWAFGSHYFVKLYNKLVLNDQTMFERYMDVLEFNKPAIRECIKILTDSNNLPSVIHCAHGKDRTGLLVALVLSTIGVSDEDIVRDYSLSEGGLACIKKRMYREVVTRYGFDEKFLSSNPETMQSVLNELRIRYGSVPGYLSDAGVTEEEQRKLRELLLEF